MPQTLAERSLIGQSCELLVWLTEGRHVNMLLSCLRLHFAVHLNLVDVRREGTQTRGRVGEAWGEGCASEQRELVGVSAKLLGAAAAEGNHRLGDRRESMAESRKD
jgi:hypothetical protein